MSEFIELPPCIRGNPFRFQFALGGEWEGAHFTGGIKFTLREELPASSELTDTAARHQASLDNGQVSFAGAKVYVRIPSSVTNGWPAPKKLYWDLQCIVAGAVPEVWTPVIGTVVITPDVTRSPT